MFNENDKFCTSLAPNMHVSMLDSASHASIYRDLDENNITTFSMDDLSNNPIQSEHAASMAGLESLDQQIDINGHINPNTSIQIEPAMWDATWQQNKQNQQHFIEDYTGIQCQNVPFANTQFAMAPDLLNLMHLAPAPRGITDLNMPGYNPNESHLLRDLFHSLPKNGIFTNEDERDVIMAGIGGEIFQDMNEMQFENAMLERKRELGRGRSKGNFATERQRREQLNEKYKALKALFPNPTKSDRASIVGDAIEYINELDRTIKELRILLDKKKLRKRAKTNQDDSGADMAESSTMAGPTIDQDQSINGGLRSSWLQRRSRESLVDVRIVDEEVNIRVTQKKRGNALLFASKALDELQLELMHVSGGNIGDHHIFMFNTKICEGASVYASAVAKKLLEAMDRLLNNTIGF